MIMILEFAFKQRSDIPQSTTALTINRLCGSGFETIIQGATAMKAGDSKVAVCAGTENMSAAPFQLDGNASRWGVSLGTTLQMRDSLWDGLTDSYTGTPMGITAENLAEKYDISRSECDEFAVRSQQTWGVAKENGVFDLEIAPVEITTRKGTKVVDTDEHPRPETTVEKLSSLKPVFKKDGVVAVVVFAMFMVLVRVNDDNSAKHRLNDMIVNSSENKILFMLLMLL